MEEKMSDESFLLVSLKEDKAKKLAQVLSNDTSRQILDYLSKQETATETDISKGLKLPLSTVHYNLKLLVSAKLVEDNHFTYSKKGKQINHYSLSNKYVIIAPKNTKGLKEKLMSILPIAGIIGGITLFIEYFKDKIYTLGKPEPMAITEAAAEDAALFGARKAAEALPVVAQEDNFQIVQPLVSNIALWFLFGAIIALLLVWAMHLFRQKKIGFS